MKKTIINFAVAVATVFAFSSCQKEDIENDFSESGVRVITAEFENTATKTALNEDGKTPEWEVGDVIRVLNSSTYQDVEIISGSGYPESGKAYIDGSGLKIGIPNTMTGTLYAVYPASATAMTSCSGSIAFTIPAVQDGTFGSANICVAQSSTDDGTNRDNLVFRNATAVLKIKTAANVVGVDITAANNIAGPVTASFDGTSLNLTTSSLDNASVSAVRKSAPSDNVFYLATAPGATGSTTATCYKIDKKGSTSKGDKNLLRNVIYSMDLSGITINTDCDLTGTKGVLNGHEYVIIKAKYDGTNESYLKWATMNVGATTVAGNYATCYGDLYEWGSVETIYKTRPWTSATAGDFTNKWKEGKTNGYDWLTYCGSSSFTEWNPTPYDATTEILKPEKDAATQNWGADWRMPTAAEFKALYAACGKTDTSTTPTSGGSSSTTAKGVYWCSGYNGVAGCLFIVKDNGPQLFFPAAGNGTKTTLNSAGSLGRYWSSTLYTSHSDAYYLGFGSSIVKPQYNGNRSNGRSVRPVSD